MSDREKVINQIEVDIQRAERTGEMLVYVGLKTAKDAISMLKEQEAKPMTEYDDGWNCPRCGLKLIGKTASGYPCDLLDLPNDEIVKYCPACGQEVKWE